MLKKIAVLIVFLIVGSFYLKLVTSVAFMQNDDFYYYRQVEQFLAGDFTLISKMAPTFYLQGILGMIFVKAFGFGALPTLTGIVGIINLVLSYFIFRKLVKEDILALLFALLLFLFPINQYSLIGFMTETYFYFFALVSLFFLQKSYETNKSLHEAFGIIFYILAFFIRQVALVIPLGFSVYYLLSKQYKKAVLHFIAFNLMFVFYGYFFPKTSEMEGKGFDLLSTIDGSVFYYSMLIGMLIYMTAFALPVVLGILIRFCTQAGIKKLIVFFALTTLLYFGNKQIFNGDTLSWGEFPHLDNTYERKGFLPRDFHGTKYHFAGMHDLYYYWGMIAEMLVFAFFAYIIVDNKFKKQIKSRYFILFGFYLMLLYFTYYVWDRYLLYLFAFFVFGLAEVFEVKNRLVYSLTAIFVVFLFGYNYLLLNDFVQIRNFAWNRAQLLVEQGTPANKITVNTAWNKSNKTKPGADYVFSYDSQDVNELFKSKYALVEEFTPEFTFNIFVNPRMYLYKLDKNNN